MQSTLNLYIQIFVLSIYSKNHTMIVQKILYLIIAHIKLKINEKRNYGD